VLLVGLLQYLDIARNLAGYGEIALPHCACDARKDGHVIAIACAASFKLQACKEDGSPEVTCDKLMIEELIIDFQYIWVVFDNLWPWVETQFSLCYRASLTCSRCIAVSSFWLLTD